MFLAGALALGAVVAAYLLQVEQAEQYLGGWSFWFVVTVLGALVLIGGVGLAYTLLRTGASLERRAALAQEAASLAVPPAEVEPPAAPPLPTVPLDDDLRDSPGIALAYRLPISEQPGWRVFPFLLFCLLWNLATGVLVASYFAGPASPLFTGVVLGFVAIGLGSIYYLVAEIRQAAQLGPTVVEISDHPLHPGRRYEIYVSQTGRQKLSRLDVLLICEEEATFTHGTDVRTEARRVQELLIAGQANVELAPGRTFEASGWCEPPAGMHSFQSDHNAVQWRILVRGLAVEGENWERYFPVVVHPGAVASSQ
jgi:hypothetical protein